MTAFVPADIPAEVNTIEKLHAWTGAVLQNLYSDVTVIESAGSGIRAISCAPFQITAEAPSSWRYIVRASLLLDKNWQGTGNQFWTSIQDLGQLAIPVIFKS